MKYEFISIIINDEPSLEMPASDSCTDMQYRNNLEDIVIGDTFSIFFTDQKILENNNFIIDSEKSRLKAFNDIALPKTCGQYFVTYHLPDYLDHLYTVCAIFCQ